MTRFQYVAPPLPQLVVRTVAVFDLAETMRIVYPGAGALGSMARLSATAFLHPHQDEATVQQWLFARFTDLPSIDAALADAGYRDEVPRGHVAPLASPIATTAIGLATIDAETITSDPLHGAKLAAGLFWFIADRVSIISTAGAASIMFDAGDAS